MADVPASDGDSKEAETASERTGRQLVYFAAERTLLAWIRAALALMALGFVIDRFGLVVHAVAPQLGKPVHSSTMSFMAGTGMVVTGAALAVVAAVRYAHFAWRYKQSGDTEPGYGLSFALVFTGVVAVAGAIIAGYLMTVGY